MMNFFLLSLLVASSNAWFESCSNEYSIPTTSTSYFVSQNYPNRYQPGSSCKWYLVAPTGYTIDLKCSFNVDEPLSDCQSQKILVSREGDKDLNYAERFCGYSEFTRKSVGNEISFAYTSNADGSGWLYCEVKAVLTTQENCQCGLSKTARIIGGSVAQPNEYVSMAALVDVTQQNAADGPIFCGAAIISEDFALTAAHCFNNHHDTSLIYLLVGDHDISKGNDTPYASLYSTQRIIKHESYIPESDDQNNDIALLRTNEAIRWKRTIGPACLPYMYEGYETYFDGYSLVVLGWGSTEFAGPTSSVLKKTSLTVIPSLQCNETYSDINSSKICAYTKGTDACQRDSGGSLYWTYGNRQYTVGIVSYGRDCASKYPSVNTRVTSYLEWIEQHTNGGFLCRK